MSYSYSGNPADSNLDLYRFKIGDTGELAAGFTQQDDATPTTGFLLQNEEINFVLDNFTNANDIMYNLYNALANKIAKYYKRGLGPQSEDPTTMYKHYRELAAEYKVSTSSSSGLSVPTYNVSKIFTKGMHDNV